MKRRQYKRLERFRRRHREGSRIGDAIGITFILAIWIVLMLLATTKVFF